MRESRDDLIKRLAKEYNRIEFFQEDPIIFPRYFAGLLRKQVTGEYIGDGIYKVSLQDVEIAGIVAAHLAWGRRCMIIRDCERAFDEMKWQPFKYVKEGNYRGDNTSLHRTVMWSDFAKICENLNKYYSNNESLESLSPDEIRTQIYGQKSDPKATNKKINMFRRWMVRDDGIVDIGIWRNIDKKDLIIPLDIHVHRSAIDLDITQRISPDFKCAQEITEYLKSVFPDDPCLGDYALFSYSIFSNKKDDC